MLKEDETTWYCISCSKDIFPFSDLNDNQFHTTTQGKKIKFLTFAKKSSNEHRLLLERTNDAIGGEDLENSSIYFDINDLNSSFPKNQFNGTIFFNINIFSLCHNFDDLQTLLNVASLSLLYRHYFGRCSSELTPLVPLHFSCGGSNHYSDRLHDFSGTIPRCYKDVCVNSFFPHTTRPWNSLPIECFPLTFNLNGFKSRINSHLLTVGSV